MARPADPNARASLVAAARAEFVRHGILKARVEDITQACGLSKGAFYLHFDSKEALFRELTGVLEAAFEQIRADRERAYLGLVAARAGDNDHRADPTFVRALSELDAREDRRLLDLLWDWRDVIDVLLRGCQGTEFDGVMWQVLDQQLERLRDQCLNLQRVRLVRDDVSAELLGMMVVGTYMFVARRLVQAKVKPDFGELVTSLQRVMNAGMAPAPRASRTKAPRLSSRVSKKNRSSR